MYPDMDGLFPEPDRCGCVGQVQVQDGGAFLKRRQGAGTA